MKTKMLLLLICLNYILLSQNKYVYMGEMLANKPSYMYVRIDGSGDIYPDLSIDLTKPKYSTLVTSLDQTIVEDLYKQNGSARKEILEHYKLNPSGKYSNYELDSIILKAKADSINFHLNRLKIDNVTFIMVGYNNYYKNTDVICAPEKLQKLRDRIETVLNDANKKTLIVELYWDGTASLKDAISANNLRYGSANSYWAGIELRRLVNQLSCNKVQFISHSMGANVITECVFNQIEKVSKNDKAFNEAFSFWQNKVTPPTKIMRAGLIAPAIPGTTTFEDYIKSKNFGNCQFIVGHNVNDLTLSKRFGALKGTEEKFTAKHFSSTSLGCLNSEKDDVEALFLDKINKIIFLDFSINADSSKQTIHDLAAYMNHPNYNEMLKQLFEIK